MGVFIDIDLGNGGTRYRIDGISFGSQDHAERGAIGIPRELRLPAIKQGTDAGTEIGAQTGEHHFRLRVAEPGVVLDDLRAVLGGDQTGIENAGEGDALIDHGLRRRLHNRFNGLVHDVLTDLRDRAVSAHTTRIRTLITVIGAFVVLRDGHRPELGASDETHQ